MKKPTIASKIIDLVKVEYLGPKFLVHTLVQVRWDLGQTEIDDDLDKLVGIRNLVDMAVFFSSMIEPVFLCNTMFLDP